MQEDAKRAMQIKDKFKFLYSWFRNRRFLLLIPDSFYLRFYYRFKMGRKLDLNQPKAFNEKIQWLKLYDRNPAYTIYADKYEVREYVKGIIGEKYLIPLLGVWDQFDEIDFEQLPNRFVLKCTHDSGGVVPCTDKTKLDLSMVKEKINRRMAINYYDWSREWAYKHIQPRIICEEFIESKSGLVPNDYKIHCFNGEPKNIMVCGERESGETKFFLFDRDWNRVTFIYSDSKTREEIPVAKPEKLDEMLEIARALSKGLPFVRVDLYYENGQIYFGEMTLYPQSGYDAELLVETDLEWGSYLALPK